MTFEFKRLMRCSLLFLILLMGQNSLCSIEDDEEVVVKIPQPNNNTIITKNTLGEQCWIGKCSERQICNDFLKCECSPGFINRSNVCVPCAGENEKCFTPNACCERLVCFNGICRKATPNAEFITLAKVCLGITITSIIIALLTSLLKCLMRFDSFRRFRGCRGNLQSENPVDSQGRHILESQFPSSGMQEEKPPSYEECMRTGRRTPVADPPPPYVISSNDFTMNKQNYILSVRNITEFTPPNGLVPSNNQASSEEQRSKGPVPQKILNAQSS